MNTYFCKAAKFPRVCFALLFAIPLISSLCHKPVMFGFLFSCLVNELFEIRLRKRKLVQYIFIHVHNKVLLKVHDVTIIKTFTVLYLVVIISLQC